MLVLREATFHKIYEGTFSNRIAYDEALIVLELKEPNLDSFVFYNFILYKHRIVLQQLAVL